MPVRFRHWAFAGVAELVYAPGLEPGPYGWGFESLRRQKMGKRTNPVGLRSKYAEAWKVNCAGPSYARHLRFGLDPALHQFISQALEKKNNYLFWSQNTNTGFAQIVDVFCEKRPTIYNVVALKENLSSVFTQRVVLRYHSLKVWLARSRLRKQLLVDSIGFYKRFRENRFFFRTAGFMLLGASALSSSVMAFVVCEIFKKHTRHWLIFRFLKNALSTHVDRSSSVIGLRLLISGKINGRSRKGKKEFRFGIMPLQAVSNDIDYSYRVVVTKFGVFGIKLWLLRSSSW